MSDVIHPERTYTADGVLVGEHTAGRRLAYIRAWIDHYDKRHPGNQLSSRRKRKYARLRWQKKVTAEIEEQRKLFESALPKDAS